MHVGDNNRKERVRLSFSRKVAFLRLFVAPLPSLRNNDNFFSLKDFIKNLNKS